MNSESDDDIIPPIVIQKTNWTKYDTINLIYWNANSIRNKIYAIENEINSSNGKIIHIIAITESRIFEHETEFYNLPKYNSYFNCRKDGHGGVCLFVHETMESNLIESSEESKINYVIVNIPSIRSSVAVVYKKPSVSYPVFANVLTKTITKTNRIILVGDTNTDIQKQNSITHQYTTLIRSLGCHLLNDVHKTFATRINNHSNARQTLSSTIDHLITNNINFKFNIGINDSHFSDHKQMFISFHDTTNSLTKFAQTNTTYTYTELNLSEFKRLLRRELFIYKPNNISALLHIIANTKNDAFELIRCTVK